MAATIAARFAKVRGNLEAPALQATTVYASGRLMGTQGEKVDKAKKAKPFRKTYYPVIVYLDALEDIYYGIREKCQSVELSSADYTFESLEAAKVHFGSEPQVDISVSGSRPYVTVELSRLNTSLHVSEAENAAQLYYDLDAALTKSQRAAKFLYAGWIWAALIVVNAVLSVIVMNLAPSLGFFYLAVTVLGFIFVCWNAYILGRRHSIVIFARRSEAKSFLDTNRNAIIMSLITSIVSGAVGYGFAKLKETTAAAPPAMVEQKQSAK